ncbi:Gfo/Idh/MocA family oxidoreductase [Vibrio ostreicida]|uniref:Gfo/Idh/MocA family oxidoreductase n=1 Tax=Vibrio ostreicida TaxID=526588 RepID=UPI003B5C0C23
MNRPKKVVIVGVKFGELYLNAFIEAHPELVLAGIISKGSPRSKSLAEAFGVPLYNEVEQLPQDIDIACVVIRASVIGGAGNLLVEALLKRNIHVIQEHPVSAIELKRHHALATAHGVHYRVNSFYATSTAGRTLIESCQSLRSQTRKTAIYGNLTTSRQLLYSTLDILLQSLGEESKPTPIQLGHQKQFDIINLTTPNGDYLLQLQNYLDPNDPDMHSLAMHRVMLGWESGYLSLSDSYGPVIWTPTLHADDHQNEELSLYQSVTDHPGHYLNASTTQVLHNQPSRLKDHFENDGPQAVMFVLEQFSLLVDGRQTNLGLSIQHQINVAELWDEILALCGKPHEQALPVATRVSLPSHTLSGVQNG